MAASQARLLSMTARISNNEFEQQAVAHSKQRLAENSSRINDDYLDALNQTKYQLLTGYNGSEACYADVTYTQLTGFNSVASGKQYLVKDNTGKVLVSQKIAEAFEKDNGDFNKFLRNLGLTQSDIDVTKYATAEDAIHNAWDKYLNSVGKSIYDVKGNAPDNVEYKGEHILGFGFTSFSNTTLDGYPTYNSAYASSDETVSRNLFKDNQGGYYFNRYAVETREYQDENNETVTGVFYQTAEQEGTDQYTQLLDVTYDASTQEFTYINNAGEEVKTKTLYASERPDGSADLSENQKNYLTKMGANYVSESGFTYTVTDQPKALNFEGTTQAQRDLYDYAVAITEAYYNNSNSQTSANLKYDAQQVSYYRNIFNEMRTCGYTTLDKSFSDKLSQTEASATMSSENKVFQDAEWMVKQLKAGKLVISYYSTAEKSFIGTTLDDDESITEKEDKAAIAIAQQEYTSAMDRIEHQDKQFDMQLNKLESEHTALQTEYEQVAKIISKNVEKSFNIFNA